MGIFGNDIENEISSANISETRTNGRIIQRTSLSAVTFTDDCYNDIGIAAADKPQSARKPRKNYKRSHHCIPRQRRSSLPGLRSKRRQENLEFLLAQIEGVDIDESRNVDLCDLIEIQPSAFTELFQEEEKMSAWNNFINSSEDEQLELLKNTAVPVFRKKSKNGVNEDIDEDGFITIDENTPDKAFARINYRLRHFLSRKQIPKGEIEKIEIDLMEFFLEWPNSVYVTCLPDGFRRMLLHAVSQYLDLDAKSFDSNQGNRKTQVEAKGIFIPPETTLVNYLETVKLS